MDAEAKLRRALLVLVAVAILAALVAAMAGLLLTAGYRPRSSGAGVDAIATNGQRSAIWEAGSKGVAVVLLLFGVGVLLVGARLRPHSKGVRAVILVGSIFAVGAAAVAWFTQRSATWEVWHQGATVVFLLFGVGVLVLGARARPHSKEAPCRHPGGFDLRGGCRGRGLAHPTPT